MSRHRKCRWMPRSMGPRQIDRVATQTSVGQTDAFLQSDFPTAKHGEVRPDSSSSCGLHVRHLPSSCAEIIVGRPLLVRSNCYTIWVQSTQPACVAATAASPSSLCQALSKSSGLVTRATPCRATCVSIMVVSRPPCPSKSCTDRMSTGGKGPDVRAAPRFWWISSCNASGPCYHHLSHTVHAYLIRV